MALLIIIVNIYYTRIDIAIFVECLLWFLRNAQMQCYVRNQTHVEIDCQKTVLQFVARGQD